MVQLKTILFVFIGGDPENGNSGGGGDPRVSAGHPGGEPPQEQWDLSGVSSDHKPYNGERKSSV